MKTIKFLTIGLLFIGMTAISSCKKDYITKKDAKNQFVQNGQNNNTVQSETFTVYSSDWSGSSSDGYWNYIYHAPDLDMSGAVLLYMYDGDTYTSISTTSYASNFDEGIGYAYNTSTKKLQVQHYNISGSSLTNPGLEKYKIVTIPTSGIKQNPDVNLKNYQSVKKTFNLAD